MTVMDAIRNRRSVRSYSDKPIPQAVLQRLCEALRLAPSACNYQPWRFDEWTRIAMEESVRAVS